MFDLIFAGVRLFNVTPTDCQNESMRIDQVKEDFKRHLTEQGLSPETIDSTTSILQMLSWYENARVDDAAPIAELRTQLGDGLDRGWKSLVSRPHGDRGVSLVHREV